MLLLLIGCRGREESPVMIQREVKQLFRKADSVAAGADRERIIDSAFAKLRTSDNDTLRRSLLFNVAARYEELGARQKYLDVCKLVYAKAKKQNDTVDWAQASSWIGDYYQNEMQTDSAFKYYLQSEKMYRLVKDSVNYGRAILNKSTVLYHSGNFPEGINQAIRALKVLKHTNDQYLIYNSYVKIALSLKEVQDYAKALEYFNRSFAELEKLEKTPNFPVEHARYYRAIHYNNMGTIYERLQEYGKAIGYYNQGLQIENLYERWPELYAALLSNLAYAQMKSGDNGRIESLLLRSLRIRDSLEVLPGIISSKTKIGEYYLLRKDTARALQNFREGFELARKIKVSAEMLQTLKLLTENDSKNKDYYSDLYFKISDSVQNVERATQNKFARIAYETDQIEEQNQLLSRRNKIIIIVSLFVLLTTITGFVILRLRAKNKELRYVKEQQEANEKIYELMLNQQYETEAARNEERNRIAMELHDGIVNSVFTTRFNLMQLESGSTEKKNELVRELEKTEQEIRKVSHDLQQSLFFEDKNLPEILGNLVNAQQNDFNTEFDLSVDRYIDWSVVSGADKIHVYRIIQEAIQNVNKYSKAAKCLIMLLKTGDKITIRVWDNGVGFQVDKAKDGIGLRNIKTRTEALQGELRIISTPDNGTTIEVVF
ncbi:ATP-binding protein [Flavobacterium sp.]|uniref:tetratricopeptide repeat-containing sensor histidine kinase n=1 Tax=Flavobacterium sp. TaxID=239 RepID=UPI0039E32D13